MPRSTRPISFTCTWCYATVTEDRAPGPTPQYCRQCAPLAKRAGVQARVKKHREQQPRTGFERPRGRPKKG